MIFFFVDGLNFSSTSKEAIPEEFGSSSFETLMFIPKNTHLFFFFTVAIEFSFFLEKRPYNKHHNQIHLIYLRFTFLLW